MKRLVILLNILQLIILDRNTPFKCLWIMPKNPFDNLRAAFLIHIEFICKDNENPLYSGCGIKSNITYIDTVDFNTTRDIVETNIPHLDFISSYLRNENTKIKITHLQQNNKMFNTLGSPSMYENNKSKLEGNEKLSSVLEEFSDAYLNELNNDNTLIESKPKVLFQNIVNMPTPQRNDIFDEKKQKFYMEYKKLNTYFIQYKILLKNFDRELQEVNSIPKYDSKSKVYKISPFEKGKLRTHAYDFMSRTHEYLEFPIVNYFFGKTKKFQTLIPGISTAKLYFKCLIDEEGNHKSRKAFEEINTDYNRLEKDEDEDEVELNNKPWYDKENSTNQNMELYLERTSYINHQFMAAGLGDNSNEIAAIHEIFDKIEELEKEKSKRIKVMKQESLYELNKIELKD
eukprot:GAHX01002529.1.p2 GENE.GAHX01002529.1~~GAHX01002529.1.p2  ORF type:complete len:401 (+),score=79.30 GAHX01002529.1:1539-2741(+)